MVRQLEKGILDALKKYTKNSEVSALFMLWTGISAIASALGRDCYIDMGYFTIYPNMYIVLTACSARCRKSTAIRIVSKFMQKCDPKIKILSQKTTAEGIIGNLAGLTTDGDNMIINEADGVLIVDEMVTLIDRNAFKSGLIPILMKLYDCDDFTYETRGRGIESIVNPCLSILGGTTIENIKESIPIAAIGAGFTSRIIFVWNDTLEKYIPFPTLSKEAKALEPKIQNDLNDVVKMRGKFSLTDEAVDVYTKEYTKFMKHSKMFNDPNLDGYAGRRHVNLLKTSMAISASTKSTRVIDRVDMKISIAVMEMVEKDMDKVLKSVRSEFVGEVGEEVLDIIRSYKVIPRSTLVKKMAYRLTSQNLNVILETLLEYEDDKGNKIIEAVKEGKRTVYKYCR